MTLKQLLIASLGLSVTYAANSMAGAYLFAGEGNGVDIITHPSGYTGVGGDLTVTVGIKPGSPNAADMEQPVQNAIAYFNKGIASTRNLKTGLINFSNIDFESVMIHELGHCIGMAHVNAASESGLPGSSANYTKATNGADDVFNVSSGGDGVIGSADDIRGDDTNLHWYRKGVNNPFSIGAVVDGTTYARGLADLPVGDTFSANADRSVSALFESPNTESVMQQGTFNSEVQRTPTHGDMATLKLAMSGLDETQSTADDYKINLVYAGITSAANVVMSFDNTRTGFAVCQVGGTFVGGGHLSITSADIFFNTGFNWHFNTASPCSASFEPVAGQWHQIAMPCELGISSSAKMEDVFGDDLDLAEYDVGLSSTWALFRYQPDTGTYAVVQPDDDLINGEGYWFLTLDSGITIDLAGEYSSQFDVPLAGDANNNWQMVGNPFRFPVVWADTKVIDPDDGDVLDLTEVDPPSTGGQTACQLDEPACQVASLGFFYDGTAYQIFDVTSGSLPAWGALWTLSKSDNMAMRMTMPLAEATTP